jgi:hypothetical protein
MLQQEQQQRKGTEKDGGRTISKSRKKYKNKMLTEEHGIGRIINCVEFAIFLHILLRS